MQGSVGIWAAGEAEAAMAGEAWPRQTQRTGGLGLPGRCQVLMALSWVTQLALGPAARCLSTTPAVHVMACVSVSARVTGAHTVRICEPLPPVPALALTGSVWCDWGTLATAPSNGLQPATQCPPQGRPPLPRAHPSGAQQEQAVPREGSSRPPPTHGAPSPQPALASDAPGWAWAGRQEAEPSRWSLPAGRTEPALQQEPGGEEERPCPTGACEGTLRIKDWRIRSLSRECVLIYEEATCHPGAQAEAGDGQGTRKAVMSLCLPNPSWALRTEPGVKPKVQKCAATSSPTRASVAPLPCGQGRSRRTGAGNALLPGGLEPALSARRAASLLRAGQ